MSPNVHEGDSFWADPTICRGQIPAPLQHVDILGKDWGLLAIEINLEARLDDRNW